MSDLGTATAPELEPEKLTAWQRWELPNFDGGRVVGPGGVALPTASQIDEMHRQARDEGFQAGYAEGVSKASRENERLATLIESLAQQVDEQIARELLDLSLDIARQMLHQALKVKIGRAHV